jgi:hypothetical protein
MSPSDLSKRLLALDWSGVGLEHQLAVSAAALALEGADGVLELPAFLPPRGNVLRFPGPHETVTHQGGET